jgi:hypothetical protein
MFGKYNGFVSKARVSACMYFLDSIWFTQSIIQFMQIGELVVVLDWTGYSVEKSH